MNKYDVSVLLVQYEPDEIKLKRTLLSIIKQKNISYELIIADDGSKNDLLDETMFFLKEHSFANYIVVKNETNKGTVKNSYSGAIKASGKYIYSISPGDIFFDENVLHRMVSFCEDKNCKVAFGNAIKYNIIDGEANILGINDNPKTPYLYKKNKNSTIKKIGLMIGNGIVGTSIIKEREHAVEYLKEILNCSKYVEDNTSITYALFDGIDVLFSGTNTIWYEVGSGVSTSGSEKWKNLLENDYKKFSRELKRNFPNDNCADALYIYYNFDKKKRRRLLMLYHPYIQVLKHYCLIQSKMSRTIADYDINQLKSILEE